MGRAMLAALAGAAVYFLFVMSSWVFLGVHSGSYHTLPDDEPVTSLLKLRNLKNGPYVVPGLPEGEPASAEEAARRKSG